MNELTQSQRAELFAAAERAQTNAYAPYSVYPVGAALLTADGNIYSGCNVENMSFGLTICAERVAIAAMICAGQRSIRAVAIVTKDGGTPCGMCRQMLMEFAESPANVEVCTRSASGDVHTYRLSDLLPAAFSTTLNSAEKSV